MDKVIKMHKEGNEFVAKAPYHARDLLNRNGARFRWNSADKTWRSKDITRAVSLFPYLVDNETTKELKKYIDQMEKNLQLSESKDSDFKGPVPKGLSLYGFQDAGVEFLVNNKRVLLGDSMGLGKTIVVISACNYLETKRNLIICPASLKLNWRNEIKKWSTQDLPIYVIDSKDEFPEGPGWYIINYDITHKFHKELREKIWPILVCDEAHYIKNVRKGTKRATEVLGIKKWNNKTKKFDIKKEPIPSDRAVFASGTPIENRPIDLFYLLNYLDPIKWSSYWKYAQTYCDAKPDHMGYWQVKGAKNLDKLNYELRSTIMIRRLKEEVLTELPPKTRQVIELSTNSKIKKILGSEKNIKKLQEDRIEELKAQIILSKASENKDEYREAVKALRDVNTYIFEEIAELRSQLAEYKIPDVINHIAELIENGIKVVSFSHHHTLMKAIQDHFGDICVSHNGKMSKEDKQDSVDRFQSDDSIRLFNGSIMASGVGITLTEGEVAVFNELDWRPSIVNQAEDRLVRIGQTKNVLAQYLVYEDSIDVELAKTIVEKQDIIDKALDSEVSIEEQLLLNIEAGPAEVDTEVKTEPVNLSKKAINEEVKNINSETIWDIGEALIGLSGLCDGAFQRDDLGFNLIDAKVGKSLAMSHQVSGLTPKQAALGKAIIKKYKRQIPKSLYDKIFS